MNAARLLLRNAHTVVTMTPAGILRNTDVLLDGHRIAAVGPGLVVPDAQVLDARWCVVYPGFINTHHHCFQSLTRNLPRVHNSGLFDWLTNLYQVWRHVGPEAIQVAAEVAFGELLLSGCTCTSDHFYLFPRGCPDEFLDIEIEVARRMGIRFHPNRGSMTLGQSRGGLPPDDLAENEARVLRDSERVIARHHDPAPFSMCRVALAPCAPFNVSEDLLRETLALARAHGIRVHTHLCETRDEESYCVQRYGVRPFEFMERLGWVGEDVWYAHGIHFNPREIERLAATGTGIAHCPSSNLRLGSGICPVPALLRKGVRVGLAVDGSSSNDSGNFVRELQMALLVHRVGTSVDAMPPAHVLELATRGGADLLGRPELGRIEPGAAADLAVFALDRIDYAGAMHAPESALIFCGGGTRTRWTIVHGRIAAENGALPGIDERELFHRANRIATGLVAGE